MTTGRHGFADTRRRDLEAPVAGVVRGLAR